MSNDEASAAAAYNNNNDKTHPCAVCQAPATKHCGKCRSVWYCGVDHQRSDWKARHKAACRRRTANAAAADQLTLHKQEFDRIVKAYGLNDDDKATAIAEFLTSSSSSTNGNGDGDGSVSAAAFAAKFGVPPQEAVIFLEWIQKGVQFKEQSLDVAKKAGMR